MLYGMFSVLRRGTDAMLQTSKRTPPVRPPTFVNRGPGQRLLRVVQEALSSRTRDLPEAGQRFTARALEEFHRATRRRPSPAGVRPSAGGDSGRRTGIVADSAKSERRRHGERRRRQVSINFPDRRQRPRRREDLAQASLR